MLTESVEGFLFETLTARRPDVTDELSAFKVCMGVLLPVACCGLQPRL